MSETTKSNPVFAEYLIGILKLHELEIQNKDGDEYDDICDKLDLPWRQLTAQEREDAGKFSALLYVISDYLKEKNQSG